MKNRQTVLLGIGIGAGMAVILIFVFLMGAHVGSRKAGLFPFWERRCITPNGFIPERLGHGVIGTIDSLGDNTFIVKDRGGALKTVLVSDQTILQKDRASAGFSDLKKDEQVMVIGQPQEKEGAIEAKVVRIMPAFPKEATTSSIPFELPRFRRGPQ